MRAHRWQPAGQNLPVADIVLNHLIHEIDLACWLFDGLPTEVYATSLGTPANDSDYVQLHLGFPGGGMAVADYCCGLPQGDEYFSLCLIGDNGAAYADDHRNMQLLYTGGNPAGLKRATDEAGLVAEFSEFVDAIRQQREPATAARDEVNALKVVQAASTSVAAGHVCHLINEEYECTGEPSE